MIVQLGIVRTPEDYHYQMSLVLFGSVFYGKAQKEKPTIEDVVRFVNDADSELKRRLLHEENKEDAKEANASNAA